MKVFLFSFAMILTMLFGQFAMSSSVCTGIYQTDSDMGPNGPKPYPTGILHFSKANPINGKSRQVWVSIAPSGRLDISLGNSLGSVIGSLKVDALPKNGTIKVSIDVPNKDFDENLDVTCVEK